jgi:hypothetical protein
MHCSWIIRQPDSGWSIVAVHIRSIHLCRSTRIRPQFHQIYPFSLRSIPDAAPYHTAASFVNLALPYMDLTRRVMRHSNLPRVQMKPATPTSKEPAIFTCRTLQPFVFLPTLSHDFSTTRIVSVADLPQATDPQHPSSPNVVEPQNPQGHSAYYIKETLAWIIVIVALFVLFLSFCAIVWALLLLLCAMVWALHQDWPYFWGAVLVAIGFSQIRQYGNS